jgi:hypothetical protein
MDAFSAMEYPHWLIVAGAILVVTGIIGLALRQKLAPVETRGVANGNEQRRSEFEAETAQTHRKVKLAEQTRDRWATDAKPTPSTQEHSEVASQGKPSNGKT